MKKLYGAVHVDYGDIYTTFNAKHKYKMIEGVLHSVSNRFNKILKPVKFEYKLFDDMHDDPAAVKKMLKEVKK